MFIYFDEDNMPDKKTANTMTKAATYAAAGEGLDAGKVSLSVSFVGAEEIHALNTEYRNVDRETDVLSFPAFEPGEIDTDEDEIAIGDVVICTDVAKRQAEEFGHSYERELIYLFVHSVFHLLGYDHMEEEDKKIMRLKEENIMDKLGIKR